MSGYDPYEGLRTGPVRQCSYCLVEVATPVEPDEYGEHWSTNEGTERFQTTPDGTPITTEHFPDADAVCYQCGRSWPIERDEWFPAVATAEMLLVRDDGEINRLMAVDGETPDEIDRARLSVVNSNVADEWVSVETMNDRFRPDEWGWEE